MYQIGDLIIYGGNGVCRVDDIGMLDIPSLENNRLYYTLSSYYRDLKILTPVDTNVFMRSVIKYEEALELIKRIPKLDTGIYEHLDARVIKEHYHLVIESNNCLDMLQLIKNIYAKQKIVKKIGNKLTQVDEQYKKRAQEIIDEEFAIALCIQKEDVKDYIKDILKDIEMV